jgi:hypothetical protein
MLALRSFIHSFIHSVILAFPNFSLAIHSPIHSFLLSFHSFIRSFVRSFVDLFTHSLHSFAHLFLPHRSFHSLGTVPSKKQFARQLSAGGLYLNNTRVGAQPYPSCQQHTHTPRATMNKDEAP